MHHFIDNGDNTITDTKTGLIWTKNTVARDVSFNKAEEIVAALGDGWRLPTVDELFTLVDRSRHKPAIDAEFFPDTANDYYWTSERCIWSQSARWVVGFHLGYVYVVSDYDWCVRAVRVGQ